jgi:hypothetical protein
VLVEALLLTALPEALVVEAVAVEKQVKQALLGRAMLEAMEAALALAIPEAAVEAAALELLDQMLPGQAKMMEVMAATD